MPPPVVGLTSPAASPTASSRVAVGARNRTERQDLESRIGPAVASATSKRARSCVGEIAKAAERARLAHQAEPRVPAVPSRSNGTSQANPPGATSRPRCTSTSAGTVAAAYSSCALCTKLRGDAEAELPVEPVVRAAREHAGARAHRRGRRRRRSTRRRRRSRSCGRARRCAARRRRRGSRRRAPDRTARDRRPRRARSRRRRRRRCRPRRRTAPRAPC